MHLIEDLVEGSVRALHLTGATGLRDHFAVLYDFQSGFDCSFTHFRVMDILLAHGFTYRFPLERHPDYRPRSEFFDGITGFTALSERDGDAGEDLDDNWLDEGYVDPPHLYCDAGTSLWRRMAESGVLTGADAEPLRRLPMADTVLEVVRAAEQQGDVELTALWHCLGFSMIIGVTGDDPRDVPALRSIRDIAIRTDALSFPLPDGYRPPSEFVEDDELEAWWAALRD